MKQLWSDYFPEVRVFFDEPLEKYTFTKTGGNAEMLVFPRNIAEVRKVLTILHEKNISVTILGNASNVIVRDGGIQGAVIMLEEMHGIVVKDTTITAQAGALLVDVSKTALEHHLTGLEFACGIPGSMGGAIYMNAGAYGGEMCDVVSSVEVVTKDGILKTYTKEELEFSYRHSKIQETQEIVLTITVELEKGNQPMIAQKMEELTQLRQSKQPLEYPSCGSVFKRPVGHFTGQLIQEAGLQGFQIGGAQVSKKHAGFIVNIDHATASDYLDVIHHVQKVIWEKNHVQLEPEVKIIGNEVEEHKHDGKMDC